MPDQQGHQTDPPTANPRTVFVASVRVAEQWRKAIAKAEPVMLLSESDLGGVIETIRRHRPAVVIEQTVGATDRGRDFVRRLQWDPSFEELDVWTIADGAIAELMTAPPAAGQLARSLVERAQRAESLPQRRAGRIAVVSGVTLRIDGTPTMLVDLSATGAQVISPEALRPLKRIRVTLPKEDGLAKLAGTVVWCAYELPKSGTPPTFYDAERLPELGQPAATDEPVTLRGVARPHFRTGIAFDSPDPEVVAKFCARLQQLKYDLPAE